MPIIKCKVYRCFQLYLFQVLLNELVKDRMNAFKIVCEETFSYIHIRFNTPTGGFQHQEYTEDWHCHRRPSPKRPTPQTHLTNAAWNIFYMHYHSSFFLLQRKMDCTSLIISCAYFWPIVPHEAPESKGCWCLMFFCPVHSWALVHWRWE